MMIKKTKPGDLIRVPISDELHTYARILVDGSYAFYDCPSRKERVDYEEILKSDILFTAHVNIHAVKSGKWKVVVNIPLEPALSKFYPNYFMPAPTNPVNIGFYKVYKDEIENAIAKDWIRTGKIQKGGINGREHIEPRLRDYYEGKRHEPNNITIDFFKRYLGIEH